MSDPVVIVGAGPTGLALAAELGLAGVPCRVLEKRPDVPNITRAFGVHARTLELLDARGLAEEVIARGVKVSTAVINLGAQIDFRPLPTPFNHLLIVPQSGTETVLEKRCLELGIAVERGVEVVGLTQNESRVNLEVRDDKGFRTVPASYVVGCDGAHSVVREKLGVPFSGEVYDVHLALADVRLTNPPAETVFTGLSPKGIQLLVPFGDGWHRSISFRHGAPTDAPLTLDEIREASLAITGEDFGFAETRWMTRFLSERRQAAHYRVGRVLLAGDAAHVHSPAGAQGMNTGIGDATNLGWKLAKVLDGTAPSWLLDSYEAERHPVGEEVLRVTDRIFRLVMLKSPAAHRLIGFLASNLFKFDAAQRFPRSFLSGLGVHYAPRGHRPHPLAGKRAPDVTDLSPALRSGKFVLAGGTSIPVSDKVVAVPGKQLMLVRPDGYVAWAGDSAGEARRAMAEWGVA